MPNKVLTKFIEDNIDLIEEGDFLRLYHRWLNNPNSLLTEKYKLTDTLLQCEIYPLITLDWIPPVYMCGNAFMKEFEMPKKVLRIDDYAFYYSGLEHIEIPEGCEVIAHAAFADCNLKSVTFPHSLKMIKSAAFQNCHDLKNIVFNGTKQEWLNINKNMTAFLTSVDDYKGVKCLDGYVTLRTS